MGRKNTHKNNKKQQAKTESQMDKKQERKTKRELRREKQMLDLKQYQNDMTKFKVQLGEYGLKLSEIKADGNCLFRAIADQLFGNQSKHSQLRAEAVTHIEQNKELYKFFIEDDENIDDYCNHMRRDGMWGGQIEMNALAQLYTYNAVVHQVDNPSMAQEFFPWSDSTPTIHLAYHLGEHYNSVRKITDPGTGPVTDHPIGHKLEKVTTMSEPVKELKEVKTGDKEDLIDYACQLCGCSDTNLMEQVLQETFGNLKKVSFTEIVSLQNVISNTYDDKELAKFGQLKISSPPQPEESKVSKEEIKTMIEKLKNDTSLMINTDKSEVVKKPSNNQKCPCNSKLRYKKCPCFSRDRTRTQEFIDQKAKEVVPDKGDIIIV